MRGRLINPFYAKIARLDTVSMAADPDAGGELTSGYDDIFKEPLILPETGVVNRIEMEPILIPCQVETNVYEAMQMLTSGDAARSDVKIIFHFSDLERMSLVDAVTGEALLKKADRLVSIHRRMDEKLIQTIPENKGGLYATEIQPQSFGLSGGERNLLVVTFGEREKGARL